MHINNRIKARLYIGFWLVLLGSFGTGMALQYHKYSQMEKQEAQIRALIEEEDEKTLSLQQNQDYYASDAFVEKVAREQLGLIRSDEILFYNDARTQK